jgi:hypothetical protein
LAPTHAKSIALIANAAQRYTACFVADVGWMAHATLKTMTITTNPLTLTAMLEKKIWILYGRTNLYQAARKAAFRGRVLIATHAEYGTHEQVANAMMRYYLEENENHWVDENDNVRYGQEVMFTAGSLAYEYDGCHWYYQTIDESDELEIKAALNCRAIEDKSLKGTKHEHLIEAEHED